MSLPYKIFSLTDDGLSTVGKWVKDLADGVLISAENRSVSVDSNSHLEQMAEKAKIIAKETYQPKYSFFNVFF